MSGYPGPSPSPPTPGASLDVALGWLGLLADATRLRLLALLSREELTVAELVAVTGLPQSRVSTHLGRLKEAGLVRDRRAGSHAYHALSEAAAPEGARMLWELLARGMQDPVLVDDARRCQALLAARDAPLAWPDSIAGELDRHYSPGRTWEATARGLLGFITLGDVLDVGAGDGVNAALLAPRAASVTCLDRSARMLAAARERLAAFDRVEFVEGDMHGLPFPDGRFDAVLMHNVLGYAAQPELALAEAARVLRPGGGLSLVALAAHRQGALTAPYGHVNQGFEPEHLALVLRRSGLEVAECAVTSRERRKPHFEIVTVFARRPPRPRRAPTRARPPSNSPP